MGYTDTHTLTRKVKKWVCGSLRLKLLKLFPGSSSKFNEKYRKWKLMMLSTYFMCPEYPKKNIFRILIYFNLQLGRIYIIRIKRHFGLYIIYKSENHSNFTDWWNKNHAKWKKKKKLQTNGKAVKMLAFYLIKRDFIKKTYLTAILCTSWDHIFLFFSKPIFYRS